MSEPLQAGLSATRHIGIDRDLLPEHIEPGKDSVGTRVELDHVGATPTGMWAGISVTLAEVNGGPVCFSFRARDAVEEIARGKHNRFIVGIEKTAQRLRAILAKAQLTAS